MEFIGAFVLLVDTHLTPLGACGQAWARRPQQAQLAATELMLADLGPAPLPDTLAAAHLWRHGAQPRRVATEAEGSAPVPTAARTPLAPRRAVALASAPTDAGTRDASSPTMSSSPADASTRDASSPPSSAPTDASARDALLSSASASRNPLHFERIEI